MTREAQKERTTKETRIVLALDVDGSGHTEIATGLPFFDHMLSQLGKHARLDLNVECSGDLERSMRITLSKTSVLLLAKHSVKRWGTNRVCVGLRQ